MSNNPAPIDFQLHDHGSIYGLQPLTPAAHEWAESNLPDDAQQFCDQVIIEPRYVAAILDGIENDGLEVEIL